MHDLGQAQRPNFVTALAGTILLSIIAVADLQNGWKTSIVLIPLIAAWLLSLPYTVGIGLVFLACSHWFGSISWVPQPATILAVFLGTALVDLYVVRQKLRRTAVQLEAALLKEQEWGTFFETSPAAILTTDSEGRIALANQAAHDLLGSKDTPLRGEVLHSYLPALATALRIEGDNHVKQALAGCKGWRRAPGVFLCDAWFSVTKAASGTRLGAVLVDASERLQEREQCAMHSSSASSEIAISAVLHEIRNLGAAATFLHDNLEQLPTLKHNLDFKALGNLVEALAKLASAELRVSDKVTHRSVDLSRLFEQLRIIIEPLLRELDVQLDWKVRSDLPDVWGDESGLMQIFMNVVENSNKAMRASEIKHLTVSTVTEDDSVLVRFRDTGPGVTDPDELFQPLRSARGMEHLGLYVSRAIAHSMCGDLRFERVPGGSCFVLELLALRQWPKAESANGSPHVTDQDSSC
jgi:two-component system, LuxR family, sensor kinase FixL